MLLKICGITDPSAAAQCLEMGADMIGLVYYPPSPRHVSVQTMERILEAAEPFRRQGKKTVLVVVDTLPERIDSRFDFVQLHGNAALPPALLVRTIRAVKNQETVSGILADTAAVSNVEQEIDFVLEMSSGRLPGGNGAAWNWSSARAFCSRFRTMLAGGITSENVCEAIRQAQPAGIDVSSGAESAPGKKDFVRIEKIIQEIRSLCGRV